MYLKAFIQVCSIFIFSLLKSKISTVTCTKPGSLNQYFLHQNADMNDKNVNQTPKFYTV